jgi:hypothetical protein
MTNPITPPPELLQLWFEQHYAYNKGLNELLIEVARYGADQELEACCKLLEYNFMPDSGSLRAARRPKPPSLKERALALVEQHEEGWRPSPKDWDTIRRALEALPDNTSQPS